MDHSLPPDAPAPDAPILFFDSGLGGLTVLGPTRALLPTASIVYAADYAGLPYGQKGDDELAARVPALLGRLVERYQPRLVVIACNTASTIALAHVRAALDVPIVGTVPAIKPAAEMTKSGVIGVLGTEATVRQPYVDDLSAKFAAGKTVLRHGSPGLVTGAEAKLRGEAVDPAVIERAIAGLRGQSGGEKLDVIVLACTHFPLLQQELQAEAGPDIALIDGAAGIARRIAYLTRGQSWPAEARPGIAVFTRSAERAPPPLAALAPYGIGSIETI
ncbi:glutamate racemase [Sphingopyxis sp. H050]|jgi:glutamate racemase|uniref:glutamate racemase n=1 Tax=Sphingopyxis sp. H050 TaxID=1759072 RepID=UPI000736B986|nr:glutamate racemase [Sphingopyxis sp. H050]KTE22256.1 glutamate racemase [Sphingopyxis sp. H050]